MIRTNLATRPFYNERLVAFTLAVIAVLVAAATAVNIARVLRYSRSDTTLALQTTGNETQAGRLRALAARLRASVDEKTIELASNEARVANELIDRRTFSWTELFNRFETTLPSDVRITAVRPTIENDGRIALTVNLVARGVDDVNSFMNRLDETGAFRNVRPAEEHINDQKELEVTLEATYAPVAGAAKAPAPPREAR